MNQTSLNLIAITIFGLTLSSLLGPLLHVSPLVPAIAAFGLLGWGAIDTFLLQGQSSQVLVDRLAALSPQYRERIIRHEAGHFLVAYLCRIPVTHYTLTAWEALRQGQAGQGGVQFDCQELEAELEQQRLSAHLLDRYCTVWMAGIVAETLVYGKAEGGQDDRQRFRYVWSQLRRSDSEGLQKERWAEFQARNLLQQHWSAYEALVAAMTERQGVTECYQVIQAHLPEEVVVGTTLEAA